MSCLDLTPLSRRHGGSDPLQGYLARPAGHEPRPGLVMVHEIFGIDEVMRGHAERLARAGYMTLAVDLFSAGGSFSCLISAKRALTRGHGSAFADIEAARQWLTASPKCTGKVEVIGFCMGGGFALLSANRGLPLPQRTTVSSPATQSALSRELWVRWKRPRCWFLRSSSSSRNMIEAVDRSS